MKTPTKTTVMMMALCIATGCQSGKKRYSGTDSLSDCSIVGEYVNVGNDQVFVLNPALLKDAIALPLSYFATDFEIVPLDNREEALVAESGVTLSDNYMVLHSGYPPQPYKLFDRKGKFIHALGAIGQGPGEYKNIYDVQIDEPANRIYLLPWMSNSLLTYDLNGNYVGDIQLANRVPKGKFHIDNRRGTVSVVALPFEGISNVAWTQDFDGNVLDSIPAGHLSVPRDFSNEVSASRNLDGLFDVQIACIAPTRMDSLYQFDTEQNRLVPTFTFAYSNENDIPWHGYSEWPQHFTGNTSGPPVVQEMELGTAITPGETVYYIVDKETRKGAWFTLYNDYLADETIDWPNYAFANGHYIINNEPGNLIPRLKAAIKNPNLSEQRRQELTQLLNSIDENDNNYLLIATLRK